MIKYRHLFVFTALDLNQLKLRTLHIIVYVALCNCSFAQSSISVEKYTTLETGKNLSVMPLVSFESKRGWHAQARYNYEELQTASLHVGRSFSKTGDVSWQFTPLAGIVAGKLNGFSIGLNVDMECNGFFGSSASQYVMSYRNSLQNFFYNWSEAGYNISDHVYTGLSLQYTLQPGYQNIEPGILAGVNVKNISFPCYVFNLFRSGTYVVMGISFSLQ
ncbi:MAG TPA: hypothetical protein VD993_13275 [Chitinophagaceae bacterium]|nr:hypothetical protein [Chitinophagaceae bacterium]